MTDFDYDVMQKKRIASGAYHRKGTTNRKGCRLPHENLTKKELEKLNGEVTTVSMLSPISWATFKAIAPDLQEEYLDTQIKRFGVGLRTISRDLFKQGDQTLAGFVRQNQLSVIPAPNGQTPKAAKESWNRWLATGTTIAPETESGEVQYTHCEPATSATGSDESTTKPFRAHDFDELFRACGLEQKTENIEPEDEGILYPLTGMNLELKGTPVDILATLRMSFPALLDKDKTYRFSIKVDGYVL